MSGTPGPFHCAPPISAFGLHLNAQNGCLSARHHACITANRAEKGMKKGMPCSQQKGFWKNAILLGGSKTQRGPTRTLEAYRLDTAAAWFGTCLEWCLGKGKMQAALPVSPRKFLQPSMEQHSCLQMSRCHMHWLPSCPLNPIPSSPQPEPSLVPWNPEPWGFGEWGGS